MGNALNDITSSKVKRTTPSGVVHLAQGIILKQKTRKVSTKKPEVESPPSLESALVQTYPLLIVLLLLAIIIF